MSGPLYVNVNTRQYMSLTALIYTPSAPSGEKGKSLLAFLKMTDDQTPARRTVTFSPQVASCYMIILAKAHYTAVYK